MRYRLEELFDLQMGKTPARANLDYWNGTNKWVSISDLSGYDKYVTDTKECISDLGVSESGIKAVPKNTVIMSFKLSIGKTAITTEEIYTNEAIMAFIDKGICEINTDYLYYLFSGTDWNKGTNKAVLGLTLNKATLSKKEIDIPDLHTQNEVVKKLDALSNVIQLQKHSLDKLDELIKSRFVEMFGNFVYEKDKWSKCLVGDVAGTVDPQPSHRTPPVEKNGIPYIGIAECDYQKRTINYDTARKVGKNVLQEHISRYDLHRGDFIIGKIGTIGKPFFIPEERKYALSANTVLIQPNMLKVAPNYLFSVFQSEYMDRIIDAEKKSTSQPAFGIQKVRAIEIPLPPLDLQNQFADFVTQVEKQKATVQQSIDKLETLKKSLMQEYFG